MRGGITWKVTGAMLAGLVVSALTVTALTTGAITGSTGNGSLTFGIADACLEWSGGPPDVCVTSTAATLRQSASNSVVADASGVQLTGSSTSGVAGVTGANVDITATHASNGTVDVTTTNGNVNITAQGTGRDIAITAPDAVTIDGTVQLLNSILPLDFSNGSTLSGTSEEIVKTITLPAGYFSADGALAHLTWLGTLAANTNTKDLRVRYGSVGSGLGGTAAVTCSATSSSAVTYRLDVVFIRRTSSVVDINYICWMGSGLSATVQTKMINTTMSGTLSGSLELNLTAEAPTASTDITPGRSVIY